MNWYVVMSMGQDTTYHYYTIFSSANFLDIGLLSLRDPTWQLHSIVSNCHWDHRRNMKYAQPFLAEWNEDLVNTIILVSLIAVMVPTLYHSDVAKGYLERMVDSSYKVVGMVTAQQVYYIWCIYHLSYTKKNSNSRNNKPWNRHKQEQG